MAKKLVISPEEAVSYRTPMPVSAICRFPTFFGNSSFPICPRCQMTMEWEYQAFCDRCGQALDWKKFSKAVVIQKP